MMLGRELGRERPWWRPWWLDAVFDAAKTPGAASLHGTTVASSWLAHFPNTAWAVTIGLGAQSHLWQQLQVTPFTGEYISSAFYIFFWYLTLMAWILVSSLYALKFCRFPEICIREYNHFVRVYFFFAPLVTLLLLAIVTPTALSNLVFLRALWLVVCICQMLLFQRINARWMFSDQGHLLSARPPYLLSTVNWLLLAVLGNIIELSEAWGVDLPAFCLGAGCFYYSIATFTILQVSHTAAAAEKLRGQPSLFLMLAPPTVAEIAFAQFEGRFGRVSQGLMGVVLVMASVLLYLGPQFVQKPPLVGTYWAYVFPTAGVAKTSLQYAATVGTLGANLFAVSCSGVAVAVFLAVVAREGSHLLEVVRGHEQWTCPIATAYAAELEAEREAELEAELAANRETADAIDAATNAATLLMVCHATATKETSAEEADQSVVNTPRIARVPPSKEALSDSCRASLESPRVAQMPSSSNEAASIGLNDTDSSLLFVASPHETHQPSPSAAG